MGARADAWVYLRDVFLVVFCSWLHLHMVCDMRIVRAYDEYSHGGYQKTRLVRSPLESAATIVRILP